MTGPREMIIEGYTAEELLLQTDEQIAAFVFTDEPLLFRAGTATLLGQFRLHTDRLTVELAQVDGGGEGVLPTLWRLAERYGRQRGLREVEWVVHALTWVRPNPKLRRVLQRWCGMLPVLGLRTTMCIPSRRLPCLKLSHLHERDTSSHSVLGGEHP